MSPPPRPIAKLILQTECMGNTREFTVISFYTDFNECHSQPCKHGGVCSNKLNGYECSCQNGAVGKNCETGKEVKEMLFIA